MTSNPGDHRPDLTKRPDNPDATQAYVPPVNPYPEQPTYPSSADEFTPYAPPQYGDPLQNQYPAQQYLPPQYPTAQSPTAQYPTDQSPTPRYPYPPTGYPAPGFPVNADRPRPAAVGATRALGAAAVVGALLLIAYGWLNWTSFESKFNDANAASVNGWGQVFGDGSQISMGPGAYGTPYAAAFIPFFVLPVLILGILIMSNIGRFGNSIAILVLSVIHLLMALVFLAVPSACIIFDYDTDSAVFEQTFTFSTGPGAILATLTLLIVTGTSIAGIIVGRRKIHPQPAGVTGYGGYPGF